MMQYVLFFLGTALCLVPQVTGALALGLGIALALSFGQPFGKNLRPWIQRLMAMSIIGIGASMNLQPVLKTGAAGFGYTLVSIVLTLLIGICLGRLFKINQIITYLISAGTAICGGSAIAASSIALNAKEHDTSVALVTIFALNAVALVLFPMIGTATNMTANEFGLWSGIAIHDTSSVVGAAIRFSENSVDLATTVKLARALWIVPLTYALSYIHHRGTFDARSIKKPWFILGFIAASCVYTFFPGFQTYGENIGWLARRLFIVTLFLVGTTLSRTFIKETGAKPLLLASTLWIIVSFLSWLAIKHGYILI